jgi:hypothetical protein
MAGGEGQFLLVTSTGTLHMDPAHEECNIDAVKRNLRRRFVDIGVAKAHAAYRHDCRHCFPVTIPNPEGPDGEASRLPQPVSV